MFKPDFTQVELILNHVEKFHDIYCISYMCQTSICYGYFMNFLLQKAFGPHFLAHTFEPLWNCYGKWQLRLLMALKMLKMLVSMDNHFN